jgi:hypothetical protein
MVCTRGCVFLQGALSYFSGTLEQAALEHGCRLAALLDFLCKNLLLNEAPRLDDVDASSPRSLPGPPRAPILDDASVREHRRKLNHMRVASLVPTGARATLFGHRGGIRGVASVSSSREQALHTERRGAARRFERFVNKLPTLLGARDVAFTFSVLSRSLLSALKMPALAALHSDLLRLSQQGGGSALDDLIRGGSDSDAQSAGVAGWSAFLRGEVLDELYAQYRPRSVPGRPVAATPHSAPPLAVTVRMDAINVVVLSRRCRAGRPRGVGTSAGDRVAAGDSVEVVEAGHVSISTPELIVAASHTGGVNDAQQATAVVAAAGIDVVVAPLLIGFITDAEVSGCACLTCDCN